MAYSLYAILKQIHCNPKLLKAKGHIIITMKQIWFLESISVYIMFKPFKFLSIFNKVPECDKSMRKIQM